MVEGFGLCCVRVRFEAVQALETCQSSPLEARKCQLVFMLESPKR